MRKLAAAAGFLALLAALWEAARYFGVSSQIGGHWPSTVASCVLLLLPYWAFGFGLDRSEWIGRTKSAVTPLILLAAYPLFAIPRGIFRWDMCLGMAAVVLSIGLLLTFADPKQPEWRDWLVLAILGISVDLHFFDKAWPIAGLNSMPKLLFVDAGLYGYLVLRPIGGIGYDFRPRRIDFRIGLREFLFFTPMAIALGFALGFLHFHKTLANSVWFASGWVFTLFFIAVPEELFFRGLMLNMLERKIGARAALIVTALLFGLAHFNKRAAYFNWRYVILAAIAGIFYGRAWLSDRRILTSSVTHATVDTVWSIWLR
ncbi:MAG TPA: type II CAAX endopeptidase family protein [Bryobacteraceae bacterium]|nr:type II CAAX endopeptidase family protein [Bryobacteraceae bacterium]